MDITEVQKALRSGVTPSPDYPDLPNDYTAAELIAYDPKAELEYRLAKDRNPGMTRSMLMQHWRAFRIGRIWLPEDGKKAGLKGSISAFFRKAAERMKQRGR